MLGGSVAFLAAYAFLSNLAIVVLAPLVLPLIATGQIDTPFLETMSNVFMRVGPTMLFPLLAAWLIQYAAPKVNAVLLRWGILAYYLWAGMLVILMGGTFEQLLKPGEKDYQLEIFLALTGIAVCTANFILGKSIGSRFHRRRTCSATRRTLGRYERPTALLHPHRIRHTAAYLRSTDVSPQPLSGSHVVP